MKIVLHKPTFNMISVIFLASASVTGCGGGGGGGGASGTPNNAVAVAGTDQYVARDSSVTLDGSGSNDPENDSLTYTWTQTYGPDVTGGTGALNGMSPSFTAPTDVSTVMFDLTVTDGGSGDTTADSVQINILEHTGQSYYVDGDNGSDDTGDGSRDKPFATIFHAINEINSNSFTNYDVYVKTLSGDGRYDETNNTLNPGDTTSLYGGYGADWVRDVVNNRTGVDGNAVAVRFANVSGESWFSGFDLTAADGANASSIVSGVSVEDGAGTLYVQDNTLTAGNVGAGVSSGPASSYGLRLANVSAVRVLRNTISAGNGGKGQTGSSPSKTTSGGDGSSASGRDGASRGAASNTTAFGNAGGKGGTGGFTTYANGTAGINGSSLPDANGGGGGGCAGGVGGCGSSGGHGHGGYGGNGGEGGDGATGVGSISAGGYYSPLSGDSGNGGNSGAGGGGGGGGEANAAFSAGGGGGGGGGGYRGLGGTGGRSGGASIGILIAGITDTVIDGNTVASTMGGDGGNGGSGGASGDGGNGGDGATGTLGAPDGGSGGGGGKGGQGGQGGGGAGGPSHAIMVGTDIAPIIQNNVLISQAGGTAGSGGTGGRDGKAGTNGTSRTTNGVGATSYNNSKALNGTPAEGGYSYGIFDVNPNDGLVPAVNNNTVNVGTPGANGQSGEQNF